MKRGHQGPDGHDLTWHILTGIATTTIGVTFGIMANEWIARRNAALGGPDHNGIWRHPSP